MIDTLNERTSRLILKGQLFKCGNVASKNDVEKLETKIIHAIDPSIEKGKYTKKDLDNKLGYSSFVNKHCRERKYMFQIRKCNNALCCNPSRSKITLPWLPDPELDTSNIGHYKSFESVLGLDTTEDLPSTLNDTVAHIAEQEQGCKNSVLTAQNVRGIIDCYECGKPRCKYAKNKLSLRQNRSLKSLRDKYDYSCGSVITPDGHALQGVIFCRLQLSCISNIEFPYYSSGIGRSDLCCHCAKEGAERDKALCNSYKIVLPVCKECLESGKQTPKRQPKNK
ncbi:uncharacterized protein LOC126821627 [Patella vulgata]|uniref:uncharacterized protein LOC126821627 n=1 Tax=Patella vulgata TaxID=6465 RepID=UPI0024A870AE|nr:uncharacterized protein LOC126821627 [Patella vulgata]